MIPDESTIHLLFEVDYGVKDKDGGVYYCKSLDEGETWSGPVHVLRDVEDYNVIATVPGHGIRTYTGRLIVPA